MHIDNDQVEDLAKKAKLILDEVDKSRMVADLKSIQKWIDKISDLDISKSIPLINLSKESNVLRNDTPEGANSQQETLCNAPQSDSTYFKVPSFLK